ncbi:helix-turn-helix domain-containing protein [Clostridium perfringens]|uniref:helix-turn-helix transcriptional regulator n=1 Tax=Clostridium perfringens TaxID=1502 RepID=UPI0022486061|nr:helix-turn-helix transcriptional regulator [Clostridium perfringens]MCX0355916.1 helix-turn-helix domain-containing protein [Clostridium perfringens]MDM0612832.1 helix-turn-helix transcriptional regulator [Clostridium perfringens]
MERKLSFIRKDKVLSQKEVAALIGRDVSFIRKLENGKIKDTNTSIVYKLSKIYNMTMEDVYKAMTLDI